MSSLYKSPGVHIESAGDRYIPLERVETGVTAFLGATAQGPRNEPTRLRSFDQYEKNLGAGDDYLSHGVGRLFDNRCPTASAFSTRCPDKTWSRRSPCAGSSPPRMRASTSPGSRCAKARKCSRPSPLRATSPA